MKNARNMKEKEVREAELAERQRQVNAEEVAYQAREEYAKELNEEKIDLIRLKQGVISNSDKVFGQQEEAKKYTVWQKIGNWFYHSKWWLGIATFCVLVGGFLIYDYATRVEADLSLLLLSANSSIYINDAQINEMLSQGCADYNSDGTVLTEVVSLPISKASLENGSAKSQANSTQLSVQFMSDMCMLVISDKEADSCIFEDESTGPAAIYENLEELYPQYDFIEGCRVKLADTAFSEKLGITDELYEGTYLALRRYDTTESNQEKWKASYEKALPVLEKFLEQIAPNEQTAS